MIGSALIIMAYNAKTLIDESGTQGLIFGSVFGICTFVFGAVNNGGHFNPAITLAVLMQRFDPN